MSNDRFAKHQEIVERNRTLDSLFRMGISLQDAAVVTGYSHTMIKRTFAALGGKKRFNGGEPRHELFDRQLWIWGLLADPKKTDKSPEDSMTLEALEYVLKVEQIAQQADLIVSAIKLLSFPPDYSNEHKLLEDIIQPWDIEGKDVKNLSGRRLLREYVDFARAVHEPMPDREQLLTSMQVWAFRKYASEFRPQLQNSRGFIFRVLGILSSRKRQVICLRYGLMTEYLAGFLVSKPVSVEECAIALKIRPSDVRQYERKALADLRKPENKKRLDFFLRDPRNMLGNEIGRLLAEDKAALAKPVAA